MATVVGTLRLQATYADGSIHYAVSSQDDAIVRVKTKRLAFGAPEAIKFIDGIRLGITKVADFTSAFLRVYVSAGQDPDTYPETLAAEIAVADLLDFNPLRPEEGKYFSFEFVDQAVRAAWKLNEIEIFGEITAESF